ncbi:MAG TPA: phosphoribosylaminoimidazolesuccinocarboxamide synthase [Vicinamibacteria bacterium]
MERVVLETDLRGLTVHRRGKVRDVYVVDDHLLIVATDRISAFDVVLPTGIPDKGSILNQLSLHWFSATQHFQPNHVLTGDVSKYPASLSRWRDVLAHRSMLVKRAKVIPFECVVRGYLYGGGLKEYEATGQVSGIRLPSGLKQAQKFPEPLFTPSTKEDTGHDVPVSEKILANQLGSDLARRLKEASLALYRYGSQEAESKGIIIADTKFEFGTDGNQLVVIDELLTPDSSRFWPREGFQPGRSQPSFDKQFVRDYLDTLDWDKSPPGPELPPDVVAGTRERYWDVFRALTGRGDL